MENLTKALYKIARGGRDIFFGTTISLFLQFLANILIARHYSTREYGIFNLTITLFNITLVIATFGFQNSLPREIVFYKEKYPTKLEYLIFTSLSIILLNSVICMLGLIFGAENIALMFEENMLHSSIRIVAIALPLSALTIILISVSRGFRRVKEQIYFQNILCPLLFLITTLSITLINMPFLSVFSAYVFCQFSAFLLLILYILKLNPFNFKIRLRHFLKLIDIEIGKDIVLFSLPLLFSGLLAFMMGWTDTIVLGYYKTSEIVGLYNAASSLAKLIPIFMNSVGFLYTPIATQFYVERKLTEMKNLYQTITLWTFILTFPVFTFMFLFPDVALKTFFGVKYTSASTALKILSLGFMFHTLLGLNGMSLIIIGETTANLIGNLFAAFSNLTLNFLFIPKYGSIGAALATAVSYVIANVFRSFWLYTKVRIHPFNLKYVKLLFLSFVFLWVCMKLHFEVIYFWQGILILFIFFIVYILLVILTGGMSKDELVLIFKQFLFLRR